MTMSWRERICELEAYGASITSGKVKVVAKKDSILMRIIGALVSIFNKSFGLYSVTLWNTVYIAEPIWDRENGRIADSFSGFVTLAHELQHVRDRWLILFAYGLPHSLSLILFALAACYFSLLTTIFAIILGLMLLSPLPNYLLLAYPRAILETRAYAISVMVYQLAGRPESEVAAHKQRIVDYALTGPAYYYPLPYRTLAANLLDKELARLVTSMLLPTACCCHKDTCTFICTLIALLDKSR